MNDNFKKYLRRFLKMYHVADKGIDFDGIKDAQSMLKQLEGRVDDLPAIQHHVEKIFDLLEKEVYIYDTDYTTSKQYLKIKDEWESIDKNIIMRLEDYIECFLLDKYQRAVLYGGKSKYEMGNPYELCDEECDFAEALITGKISKSTQMKRAEDVEMDEWDKQAEEDEEIEWNEEDRGDTRDTEQCYSDSITKKIEKVNMAFVKSLRRRGVKIFIEHPISFELISGGLLDRMRFYLKYDISEFCYEEYGAELCKIIYFFRKLEHTLIVSTLKGKKVKDVEKEQVKQCFDLVEFLCNPSMENTSYPISRERRSNGEITYYIKKELEKEAYQRYREKTDIKDLEDIKKVFYHIADTWFKLLERMHNTMDTDHEFDFDFDFDEINKNFPRISFKPEAFEVMAGGKRWDDSDSPATDKENSKCNPESFVMEDDEEDPCCPSPIVALYSKVLRFEYLGEIRDRELINEIEIESNYDVPLNFIEEMRQYNDQYIPPKAIEKMKLYKKQMDDRDDKDTKDIQNYIESNIDWIAKYVYLKKRPNQREMDRIKNNITKVPMMLDCCVYAKRIIESKEKISKLLVISCLQAIIQDETSDVVYSFYDYQYHGGSTHKVNFCIPQKPPAIAAHKLFLARQVEEHWYANLGKYEQYCKLREFEDNVYHFLESIYRYSDTYPDISEMRKRSNHKLQPFLPASDKQ